MTECTPTKRDNAAPDAPHSVDEVETLSTALLDFSAICDLEQWLAQP